jgi:hypothetical protein
VVDGHVRTLHIKCSDSLDAELPNSAFTDDETDYLQDVDYIEDYREEE